MKDFVSEYGHVIFAVILVFMMIAFATPLGEAITTGILDIVQDFITTAGEFFENIEATDFKNAAPTT